MQTLSKVWFFCILLLISSVASANLTIEITRGSDQALPIGVVPFAGSEGLPEGWPGPRRARSGRSA